MASSRTVKEPPRAANRAAMKIAATFEDGTEAVYVVKPRHLIAFEDEFGAMTTAMDARPMRSMYYLAYLASDTGAPFDKWTDDLAGVEMLGAPAAEAGEGGGEPVPTE